MPMADDTLTNQTVGPLVFNDGQDYGTTSLDVGAGSYFGAATQVLVGESLVASGSGGGSPEGEEGRQVKNRADDVPPDVESETGEHDAVAEHLSSTNALAAFPNLAPIAPFYGLEDFSAQPQPESEFPSPQAARLGGTRIDPVDEVPDSGLFEEQPIATIASSGGQLERQDVSPAASPLEFSIPPDSQAPRSEGPSISIDPRDPVESGLSDVPVPVPTSPSLASFDAIDRLPDAPQLSDAEVARNRLRTADMFDADAAELEAGRFFPEFREASKAWNKEYGRDGRGAVSAETRARYGKALFAVLDGTAFSAEVTGEQAGPPTREPTARPKDEVRAKVDEIVGRLPTEEPTANAQVVSEPEATPDASEPEAAPAFGDDLAEQARTASFPVESAATSEPKDFDDLRHSGLASEKNQASAIALQRLQQNKENRANGVPEFDYRAGSPYAGFKGRKLTRPPAADKLPADADGANPEGNSGAVNRSIEDAGGGQESFNTSLVRLLETMARSQLSSASRLDSIEQMIRRSIP